MSDDVPDAEMAIEIAEDYADNECIGEYGEITDVEERDSAWLVEFRTHTFSDAYTHHVQITKSVGNVVSHNRTSRFD